MSNIDWTKLITDADRLMESIQSAKEVVKSAHSRTLRQLTGDAGVEERDTWMPKYIAALAFKQGVETDSQREMLNDEAEELGVTVDILVTEVLGKHDANLRIIGKASGLRRKVSAELDTAKSEKDISDILHRAVLRSNELTQILKEELTT